MIRLADLGRNHQRWISAGGVATGTEAEDERAAGGRLAKAETINTRATAVNRLRINTNSTAPTPDVLGRSTRRAMGDRHLALSASPGRTLRTRLNPAGRLA